MMRKTTLASAFAALAVLCTAPTAVAGKSNTQLATGGFFLGLTSVGTATCVKGAPTEWFPPCTPGTHATIWRNYAGTMRFAAVGGDAASFFTESWVIRGSCNLDDNLVGPCWGTFQGTALGGTWEGTWNGKLDFVHFGGELRFVGHGSGGGVEGLHLKLEAASEGTENEYAPMPFTARVFSLKE
jgi:hypothetical protein